MTSLEGDIADSSILSVVRLERELDELYRRGEERRMENRRELLALRTRLNRLSKSLNDAGDSFDLSVYENHLRQIFGEAQVPDPHVVKVQAQLCHALHGQEIQLKQTHITKRRNKQLSMYLRKQADELTRESGDRERKLALQVEGEKAHLDELAVALESRARALDDEIKDLRDKVGDVDTRTMTPETRVKVLCDSMYAMMQGIGFEELQKTETAALLELTTTPQILSKSKIWIDLKAAEHGIGDGLRDLRRTSSFIERSIHGGLAGSRHSLSSKRHLVGGSLHRSSCTHSRKGGIDRCSKPSKRELSKSMGTRSSIRNLMPSYDNSNDTDSENEYHDDFATETPTRDQETSRLSNTGIGQSLLELVNSNESALSPTSRVIKKLSEEVFAL